MELVMAYAEKNKPLDGGYIVAENWDQLYDSESHSISIFAGRRTGKSVNLVLRALASEYNVTIFTPLEITMKAMLELIREISPLRILNAYASSQLTTIEMQNGKRIRIFTANARLANGIDISNEEVFFDEFEISSVTNRIASMHRLFPQAKKVICIGSVYQEGGTAAKQWFKHSDTKVFIDVERISNERGISSFEYQPSIIVGDLDKLEDIYL